MFLDKDLSKIRRDFLELRPSNIDDVSRDRLEFFLWELNFLDSFLSLQSFTFAGECGMLDVAQKMKEIWKKSISVQQATQRIFFSDSDWEGSVDPNFDPFTSDVPTGNWKTKLKFRSKYSFAEVSSIPLPANKDDIHTPKFLMEFIDAVIENLNILVQIDDPCSLLYVPKTKEQIEEVLKELNLLRFFVCFVSNKCTEPTRSEHTFFTHVLIASSHAAMVAWLYLPIHAKENQDVAPGEMNALFSNLLQMKIRPIQPGIRKIYADVLCDLKSIIQPGWHPNIQNKHATNCCGFLEAPAHNLMKLPTVSNPSGTVSSNDQMAILQDMLSLIRANLIHLPILGLEFHCQDMDTVIVDAGLLIYSLYDSEGEKKGMMLEDVNQALSLDLPGNIQPVKTMIYLIIRKAFQSNLPRIHGLGYVDFYLNNLKEFQSRHSDSFAFVMNQLQIIQKELESLQPFLKAVAEELHDKHEETQKGATLLIGIAYEVEYVVDACISKEVPPWCLEHWLLDIIEEITCIKTNVAEIQEKKMSSSIYDTMNTATDHMSSQLGRTPRINEEIVGFEDVIEKLRHKLIRGTRGRDVISIVGMPGQGKTTLAYRLYCDRSVVSHFDICAQCCVSQVYSRKELLLALLHDAVGEDFQHRGRRDSELANMLRKALVWKRYLILLDDVWENSAWDDLIGCFYDANNGSRIILTTRHHEVANYARFHTDPFLLRMFNDDESWELLKSEVFAEESYSSPLEDVGRQIAKKCGGLPLSVILVAGILARMERKEESWKQVATTLSSHIHGDSKAIVEQSYQILPYHLRSCFLYFGEFLEDRVIDASRLTRLWISEAFIKCCEGKSLEDIAEGYLENLIGRNLVMISQRADSDGKVEACRLHDLLLEFCKEKATEENLLIWIIREQNANLSSNIYSRKQHVQCRLAFREVDNLEEWSSSCSLVGSVLFRSDTDIFARLPVPKPGLTISRILQNFKFLKVLDLEHHIVIDFFPAGLVYLRYLSAEIDQKSIPSSIANLSNLETLILKSRGQMLLPVTLRKMSKLRHLHISHFFTIKNAEKLLEDSSKFYDLDTLSQPYFSCVEDVKVMLRKAPNIREMECKFKGVCSFTFRVLDFSTQLETLHVISEVVELQHRYPVCISASNLKILKLSVFRLGHEHLSNIAQLQNLQVLELLAIEFDDEEWEVGEDGFPELKVLKLMFCHSLEEWTISKDAFPNLERLFLRGLENLKEIPSCFGDISSLKSIEVRECNEYVVMSARDIREIQVEDYLNSGFKILIHETTTQNDNNSDSDDS
ncbi:LOW QUALITY PROTEIN: putative late blight resistance protein homolog R1A-4 [Nicotiana tomentosiformis]|uniref:LOW QUALITY PROTEIN: putative late blight resistance protein homolog R1A-4 n=1 Tax=Nicotiana tomentosiformis TaxID=4098 RepID=UPI00388CD1B4